MAEEPNRSFVPRMGRRGFLKAGASVTGLTAVSAGTYMLWPTGYPIDSQPLPNNASIIAAFAELEEKQQQLVEGFADNVVSKINEVGKWTLLKLVTSGARLDINAAYEAAPLGNILLPEGSAIISKKKDSQSPVDLSSLVPLLVTCNQMEALYQDCQKAHPELKLNAAPDYNAIASQVLAKFTWPKGTGKEYENMLAGSLRELAAKIREIPKANDAQIQKDLVAQVKLPISLGKIVKVLDVDVYIEHKRVEKTVEEKTQVARLNKSPIIDMQQRGGAR